MFVHVAHEAVEFFELAGLFWEGVGLGALVTGPIGHAIGFVNATDTDMKLAGMRASCYALTAWAFGERIPITLPKSYRSIVTAQRSFSPGGKQALSRYEKAWADASRDTVQALEAEVVSRGVEKISYQTYLQVLGHLDRIKLCELCLDAYAEELQDPERTALLGLSPELYPN